MKNYERVKNFLRFYKASLNWNIKKVAKHWAITDSFRAWYYITCKDRRRYSRQLVIKLILAKFCRNFAEISPETPAKPGGSVRGERANFIFKRKIGLAGRCKGVHCVDLGESFPTSIYLQKLASIPPRTSPAKMESWLQDCQKMRNVERILTKYLSVGNGAKESIV